MDKVKSKSSEQCENKSHAIVGRGLSEILQIPGSLFSVIEHVRNIQSLQLAASQNLLNSPAVLQLAAEAHRLSGLALPAAMSWQKSLDMPWAKLAQISWPDLPNISWGDLLFPDNWPRDVDFSALRVLAVDWGIPVLYSLPRSVLVDLLACESLEEAQAVLSSSEQQIRQRCVNELNRVSEFISTAIHDLVLEAVKILDEAPAAATLLLAVVAEEQYFVALRNPGQRQHNYQETRERATGAWPESNIYELRRCAVLGPASLFFAKWFAGSGEKVPEFSRHAMVHAPSRALPSNLAKVMALMICTAICCFRAEEGPLGAAAHPHDSGL